MTNEFVGLGINRVEKSEREALGLFEPLRYRSGDSVQYWDIEPEGIKSHVHDSPRDMSILNLTRTKCKFIAE